MDELDFDSIDDSLLFSQRCLVERMVLDWCHQSQSGIGPGPFNVITALDALGLLDRAKVREEYASLGSSQSISKAIKPREVDNG